MQDGDIDQRLNRLFKSQLLGQKTMDKLVVKPEIVAIPQKQDKPIMKGGASPIVPNIQAIPNELTGNMSRERITSNTKMPVFGKIESNTKVVKPAEYSNTILINPNCDVEKDLDQFDKIGNQFSSDNVLNFKEKKFVQNSKFQQKEKLKSDETDSPMLSSKKIHGEEKEEEDPFGAIENKFAYNARINNTSKDDHSVQQKIEHCSYKALINNMIAISSSSINKENISVNVEPVKIIENPYGIEDTMSVSSSTDSAQSDNELHRHNN